ncbi:protein uxt [Anaeramoeba ignava]|uniref:Protein uxt n=1 Tax=Anaeramoeba ignava TaxID=1746090 RepID=A0A9Q0LN09_ANAIG|nr:protein uxt [Anaeramoeba ignava]
MQNNSKINSSQKIQEFESFINEKLKPDLQKILDLRDSIYTKISNYLILKNNLEILEEINSTELTTLMDFGANIFVQTKVHDTSKLFVDIGANVFLEFTRKGAINFIEKQEKILNEQADELTEKAAKIKANIQTISQGIYELMNINEKEKEKYRK